MIGKVSKMSQKKFESRPAVVILSIAAAVLLSGCVTEEELIGKFEPYRMEDRYPLTTRDAHLIRRSKAAHLCRNWTQDLADTQRNNIHPNHGCAVRVNMAAQIADPNDIDKPNVVTPTPAAPAATAVNRIGSNGAAPQANRSIFSLF
jgi:type IV pilus biogenesis protein CpaD/CtpE